MDRAGNPILNEMRCTRLLGQSGTVLTKRELARFQARSMISLARMAARVAAMYPLP